MNDDRPNLIRGLIVALPAALVLDALIVWALVGLWQWVTR